MKEDISRMYIDQIKLLVELWEKPNFRVVAASKSVGAVMKELHRKGYIVPDGKAGRVIRWKLNREAFTAKDIEEMKELIDDKLETKKIVSLTN